MQLEIQNSELRIQNESRTPGVPGVCCSSAQARSNVTRIIAALDCTRQDLGSRRRGDRAIGVFAR
jgi:hypothetical protein